tara:strand:+ start:2472 stop:2924 length:453 start_codon:yes stop_codon:yes gene_type:complete
MKFKFKRKKGPVTSKKVIHDGITFASGLEKYMYIALRKAKIKFTYELRSFELLPSFRFDKECYERQANSKGDYKDRGNKKILGIKYTPDFEGDNFIIETKGRANESFPLRYKMFKNLIANTYPDMILYKPQNQAECNETVRLILENINKQ